MAVASVSDSNLVETIITWKFPMNVASLLMGNRMKNGTTRQLESELIALKGFCENE